jgi:small subunit ribosomal protein S6
MYILDSNRYGRDPQAVAGEIPGMVEAAGGEMLVSRLWEERRLAYPIKGHRKGTYWLTYFQLDSEALAAIERKCHLSDSILRVLFLKVDPRIVDTVVAHANASSASKAAEEAAAAEKAKSDAAKETEGKDAASTAGAEKK